MVRTRINLQFRLKLDFFLNSISQERNKIQSNVYLQISLYFNIYLFIFWFIIQLINGPSLENQLNNRTMQVGKQNKC